MARTIQAQRIIDALRGIGLKHGSYRTGGDFTVRTEITRFRGKEYRGVYAAEYGNATALIEPRVAEFVAERAQELADAGHSVHLIYSSTCERRGGLVSVIVSSGYNPHCVVRVSRDGEWSTLPKAVAV